MSTCKACKGTGVLNGRVIDGTPGKVTCGFCGGAPETTLPPVALDPDTKKQLQTCGRKVVQWTAERDRLIKEAVAAGGSYREVGAAVGLSHTAVKFIAHGRPK